MLQTEKVSAVFTLVNPSTLLSLDSHLTNIQVQPLTPLMEEIITFQLEERALFTNFEGSASHLN